MVVLQADIVGVWSRFWDYGPAFAVMAAVIWGMWVLLGKKDTKISDLEKELKDYSRDYKELSDKSMSVLILVDDKLKNDAHGNETIKDVHRIVQEILEIEKRRG